MPYNPGIAYRGDQYIAQGNQNAWQALGELITGLTNDAKQAKATKTMIETLPDATLKELGIERKQIDQMSLAKAQGVLKGIALRSTLTDLGLKKNESDRMLQIIEQGKAEQAARARFRKDYSELGAANPVAAELGRQPMMQTLDPALSSTFQALGQERRPSGREIIDMMLKAGLPTQDIDDVGRALHTVSAAQVDTEDLTPKYEEDPKTGFRIYRSGKSNIPTGVNPEKVASGGPLISDNGEFYHNGKTWMHIKQTGAPAGSRFVTINGAIALMTPDGRVIDWKMENPIAPFIRQAIGGGATNAPATLPDLPALPPATNRYKIIGVQ